VAAVLVAPEGQVVAVTALVPVVMVELTQAGAVVALMAEILAVQAVQE
jgi:hypothetical protein